MSILFLLLAVLIAMAVLISLANKDRLLLGFENTTIVLAEVKHMFTSSLTITEDTNHIDDFYRDIEVYQVNSKCRNLPMHSGTCPQGTGVDIMSMNNTKFYALAGSEFHFNICATTNYTSTELDRLEIVVNRRSHDVHTQQVSMHFFYIGVSGEWECKESGVTLHESGYYTINLTPLSHPTSFVFNVSCNILQLNFEEVNGLNSVTNHTLRVDGDSINFPLQHGTGHSCFIATIKDNPKTVKDSIHIQLGYTWQKDGIVILSSFIVTYFIFVILTTVFLCVIGHLKK